MMTFRHQDFFNRTPEGGEIQFRVPWRRASEAPPYRNGASHLDLGTIVHTLFGIVSVLSGVYACSSSALAEVEENTSQGVDNSGYVVPDLTDQNASYSFANIPYEFSASDGSRDYSAYVPNPKAYNGTSSGTIASRSENEFNDPRIPETVWSLDTSTGAHINGVYAAPDQELRTLFGKYTDVSDTLIKAMSNSWGGNGGYGTSIFVRAPPAFQVASCGGSSAEHSNLDYCNDAHLSSDQLGTDPPKRDQSDSGTTMQAIGSDVLSSSGSASVSSVQSNTTPVPLVQAPLQVTLSPLGPCVADSCVTVLNTGPLIAPTDSVLGNVTSSTRDPTPQTVIANSDSSIYVDDDSGLDSNLAPAFVPPPFTPSPQVTTLDPINLVYDPTPISDLPPILTSQPLKPIPEAPTWVMTLIGFGAIIFVFRKRRQEVIT